MSSGIGLLSGHGFMSTNASPSSCWYLAIGKCTSSMLNSFRLLLWVELNLNLYLYRQSNYQTHQCCVLDEVMSCDAQAAQETDCEFISSPVCHHC